jgi:DNA mismatch repair protein MutL
MTNSILSLPEEVINQIAAGEVVERPAHLVKELVENSLDAGAHEINIEFSDGGRSLRVIDNGAGISPEDLPRALARHATSKIRKTEDLWKLRSFGFRGEALASISAVSDLTLISKKESASLAQRLNSVFGKEQGLDEISAPRGTEVRVEKLFENVPARLKFLKTAAAESTKIKTTLKALALANPQVTFRVSQDHRLVHYWSQGSELERAQAICGGSLFFAQDQVGEVNVKVFFGDPNTTQKTAKDIWIFAQNRWIQDRGIQAAIMDSYRHLLMHGEFPICVVFVQVPEEQIDVNIHPTKSQVKFINSSDIYRAVHRTLRQALQKAPWIPQSEVFKHEGFKYQTPQNFSESFPSLENLVQSAKEREQLILRDHFAPENEAQVQSQEGTSFQKEISLEASFFPQKRSLPREFIQIPKDVSVAPAIGYWSSLQVIGQINLTYIVTQSREAMVLVDQHAAHERVMFERLLKAWQERSIETQEFLFPLAIDLSSEKLEAILREKTSFERFGVRIEALGPETLGITSAPIFVKESALVEVIEKMAHEISEQGGSFLFERKIGDVFASFACHSAIRAGQSLSLEEMKALLQQMDEFPLSSFCPHGRPVSVTESFFELEKSFGRIVT